MNALPPAPRPARSFWPHAIIGWFVIFGSALAAWISFAVRQDMDLVRPDYYEEEVLFQNQLDRLARTAALRGEIAIQYDAARAEITLRLPPTPSSGRRAGNIHFYRPSNAALDFEVPLVIDADGLQRISTRTRSAGQWKVRARWNADGLDYFFEQTLVLDDPGEPASTLATGP